MSITVRQTKHIKTVISTIPDDAWTTIKYPDAVFDEPSGRWISRAEVAEIPFTAFKSRKKSEQVPGRLVVRRIPDLNPKAVAGQAALFDTWRFHAFFTTSTLDTVTADKTHRGHAIIEQVHADLKNSALAHLPSKSFAANAGWLVLAVIAFNLTRAAATLSGPRLAKATTGTIRRTLIGVPARIAGSARTLTLHLPTGWPWQTSWTELFTRTCGPPGAGSLTTRPFLFQKQEKPADRRTSRAPTTIDPTSRSTARIHDQLTSRSVDPGLERSLRDPRRYLPFSSFVTTWRVPKSRPIP